MTTAAIGRNDPCPCGSGQKYKRCCAGKQDAIATSPLGSRILLGSVLVLILGALGFGLLRGGSSSKEDAGSRGAAPAYPPLQAPAQGAADGLIWSEEHGHWHAADGSELPGQEAPEGAVWSEEHGHWHAADGSELPGQEAPEGAVWSEEHGHWHAADGSELPGGER